MKKVTSVLLASTMLLLANTTTAKSGDAHWGYTGHNTPDTWGSLSPKYHSCSEGKNQSPIDVRSSMDADLEALTLSYTKASKEILNNGHTVQVNIEAGNNMVVDGISFELKQFHFHTPSENHIEGKSFPLEAHFVHLDKDGNIAVLALMFEEGEANEQLANHIDMIRTTKNTIKQEKAKMQIKIFYLHKVSGDQMEQRYHTTFHN